jgi:hypothetical protein
MSQRQIKIRKKTIENVIKYKTDEIIKEFILTVKDYKFLDRLKFAIIIIMARKTNE